MSVTANTTALAGNMASPWRAYPGKWATVYVLPGSYASRLAGLTQREADRTIDALRKLLEPAGVAAGSPLAAIYLVDPVDPAGGGAAQPVSPAGDRSGGPSIVRVVQPESPGEPLTYSLVRALVPGWFGPNTAQAPLILRGIAGLTAARTGSGPTLEQANEYVKTGIREGRPTSIFAHVESNAGDDLAAASFVAFLVETYGGASLRKFLEAYDPARRDQAAEAAYHTTLGGLEETWLAGLRRTSAKGSPFMVFVRQVVPLVRPYWSRAAEVLVYMLFGLVLALAMPLASKYLVDNVIPSRDPGNLVIFIVALFLIYVISSLISMRRAYVNSWVNQRMLMDLQQKMYAHLQRLPHSFYARSKVGDIMSRMSSDLGAVQGAITAIATTLIYMTLSALGAAIALLVLSPLLGLLVLAVLPFFTISYLALRTRLKNASYERQRLGAQLASGIQENLQAYGVVRAFGMEKSAVERFRAGLMVLLKASQRLVVIGSLFDISTGLAVTLGQLMVLGVGGYLVMQGQLTIGTLLAFFGFLPSLFTPVSALAGLGQTVQTASASLDRVQELLDEPVSIADEPDAAVLGPLSGDIRLENIVFGYDPNRVILDNLNITIPAGSHVAIVGPSGSGKSTIVNLLARFWDPDSGRVLFDGHNIRDVTVESLRGQIGLVFQDTFIFDTTLRENISMARPGATDAEVAAAAAAARLESYVEALPAGYDTILGERGVRMSGGQRQRLAIARALLRDPRLLILDEATSALDAQTEREILDTLAALMPGRTTVSITHRLSLAATADRIFVLDGGSVVESGTHSELVSAGGLYQRLYEEQTGYVSGLASSRASAAAARLLSVPLFSALNGEALFDLASRLTLEKYQEGADIVRQGEQGDTLYVVGKGQLDVLVGSGDEERRVNTLEEGDYFGEMALLYGEPRTATVRTSTPAELFSLSKDDFALLMNRPEINAAVMDTIALRRAALQSALKTER